jgi:vacuolar-type H+-ATPase subunit I/STV1
MDLGGEGVSVYAEAKSEYTTQLCQYLVPCIQQYFLDLLEEAKQKEEDSKRILVMFQTLLEGISEWNVDKVQRETSHIAAKSRCDYLDELMTAVFIAHTKVLSAIRLTTKQKKLQITIPKLEHFLHRTLTECARLLWSNTYLFSYSAPAIERQKNLRLIENMLNEGVLQGIRGMLPVKSILREYLKEDAEEEEEEAEGEADANLEDIVESTRGGKSEASEGPSDKVEKVEKASQKVEKAVEKTVEKVVEKPAEKVVEKPSEMVFTGNDTLLNEERNIPIVAEMEQDSIKIIDEPPAAMDEFEDIEPKDSILPMDFEELM